MFSFKFLICFGYQFHQQPEEGNSEVLADELENLSMKGDHSKDDIKKKENVIAQLNDEMADLNKQCRLVQSLTENNYSGKDDRIEELEEALRESVRITADREVALDEETTKRIKAEEEITRLEQRLQSMQNAQSLKCHQCRPNQQRLQDLEIRLSRLLAERRQHLHELFEMKQEALEAAISERDAQLGLLEVAGIKTAQVADRAESLKAERKRLMDLMKQQNEKRVKLLLEYEYNLSSHSLSSTNVKQ